VRSTSGFGRLRALAVTTDKSWLGFAELSPVGKFLPGYEATNWFGIVAPAKTPVQAIEMLNKAIAHVLPSRTSRPKWPPLAAMRLWVRRLSLEN
jgi:tripartite-type tricarboxylate transporter receptor subunit TctC